MADSRRPHARRCGLPWVPPRTNETLAFGQYLRALSRQPVHMYLPLARTVHIRGDIHTFLLSRALHPLARSRASFYLTLVLDRPSNCYSTFQAENILDDSALFVLVRRAFLVSVQYALTTGRRIIGPTSDSPSIFPEQVPRVLTPCAQYAVWPTKRSVARKLQLSTKRSDASPSTPGWITSGASSPVQTRVPPSFGTRTGRPLDVRLKYLNLHFWVRLPWLTGSHNVTPLQKVEVSIYPIHFGQWARSSRSRRSESRAGKYTQRYSRRESAVGDFARLLARNESVAAKCPQAKPVGKARAGRGRGTWRPRAWVPTPRNRRARPRAQEAHTASGGSSVGGFGSWCSLTIQAVRGCSVDVDDVDKRGSERAPPREKAARLQGELTRGRGGEGRRKRDAGSTRSDIPVTNSPDASVRDAKPSSDAPCPHVRRPPKVPSSTAHGAGGAPGAAGWGRGVDCARDATGARRRRSAGISGVGIGTAESWPLCGCCSAKETCAGLTIKL
ncbi:hypothetical protein FB451DRAFT_1182393 [Mycena latifolia]|nr:hypothetical protein FB451DRAFT_1182393 [Mycena latifolia]